MTFWNFVMFLFLNVFIIFNLIKISLEGCHSSCKECYDAEYDDTNMQCISCIENYKLLYNTTNCVDTTWYPNYYINGLILYPCSLFPESNCYECNPNSPSSYGGICLSCNPGFFYNYKTKKCSKCKDNEYSIIISDFDGCQSNKIKNFCNKFVTYCNNSLGDITCPDEAPFFNKNNNYCQEYECNESGKDSCLVKNKKYEDRILSFFWFNNEPKYINYPGYNMDKSGKLLIEITCDLPTFDPMTISCRKNKIRKLYFFDNDGRGLFDKLNDEFEKTISIRVKSTRYFSTSIALKDTHTGEYNYFLNLEGMDYNLEFIDLKTFEASKEGFFDVTAFYGFVPDSVYIPSILLLELNEKNQYLMSMFMDLIYSNNYNKMLHLVMFVFNIDETNGDKIDVNSLNVTLSAYISGDLNLESQYSLIQTKKGCLVLDIVLQNYDLLLGSYSGLYIFDFIYYEIVNLYKWAFHKLIYLKDEIMLLCYNNPNDRRTLNINILELSENRNFYRLLKFDIYIEPYEGQYWWNSDMMTLSETRVVYTVQKLHGGRMSIYIIDFFDDYYNYLINKFIIKISNFKMNVGNRYSLLFKFKDLIGYQIETLVGENGFILFGYYNSTDPKQIINLKKDGLNYAINLGDYLNLQSNIFGYEIKHIKIIEVPNNESGLYLISNKTNIVYSDDIVDINTEISLNFEYNGTLKKGNYLFKFVGVIEEPDFEKIKYYSDETSSSFEEYETEYYSKIYNERRNLNITGRVALVQINILNDTKVFCDNKYDNTSIKLKNNKLLTCGYGQFFDVENEDEITQLNLGINYYFDFNKNVYIKCYKRCKTCSKEYTDLNMNCDSCYDNFFLRDGLCLEISKCEYNYYYDNNLDLKCVENGYYCPDFKPDEDRLTKECIQKCKINEFNNCNPTNNPISINETYKQILENKEYLNLEYIIFHLKSKYNIYGHNVSFIYTTSEKEKEELNLNYNSSSIILNECENILKEKYQLMNYKSLVIFKIETWNNHSDCMNLYYEIYSPSNLSQKLDLNLCQNKHYKLI